MKISKKNMLPFITIAAGALLQIGFLFSHNILQLISNTLPDDAFYYFQPARNIVLGMGSTLDGVNLTNGYHPLWIFVLLPIFKFFSVGGTNDTVPIYAALTVAIILSTVTAFFLYKILSTYTQNQKIISFGIFIYLFNPNLLYNVLNGLETSLVLMMLSIFIYILNQTKSPTPNPSPTGRGASAHFIYLGIVGGLLALARLDMVIVVGISYLYLLYKIPPTPLKGGVLQIFKNNLDNFFIASLTTGIIFISWMIYNFKVFGIYLTSASVTSTFINHRLTYSDNGGQSVKVFLKTIPYMLERATQQIVSDTGAPIIFLMLFGVGVYFLVKKLTPNPSLSPWGKGESAHYTSPLYKGRLGGVINFLMNINLSPIIFVTAGLFALTFVSAGLRWTFRSWYFIPLLLIWSIFITWILDKIFKEFGSNALTPPYKGGWGDFALVALSVCVAYSFFITWNKNLKEDMPNQKQMYEIALWQNQNLPAGSHIGVFNSGIQSYFSTNRVTNLDGLINNNASTAMLNNTLWQYMTQTEHLDYVTDYDSYMTYRYRESLRDANGNLFDPIASSTNVLQKIYTLSGDKDLNVYRVKY